MVERGFTKAVANGCKGGVRYRVEVSPSGGIKNTRPIGRCRAPVTIEEARDILRKEGYRQIDLTRDGPDDYTATACRQDRKFELRVNANGAVQVLDRLGPCQGEQLSPPQVRARLREQGYDRIAFIDRELPRYVVEACRGNQRVRLVIGRRGNIREEQRIGRCEDPINPRDLEAVLAKVGYDRVEILDRRGPRYRAEACSRTGDRMELVLNEWGEIVRDNKVGICPRPVSEDELLRQMQRSGFSKISIVSTTQDEYQVIACRGDDRLQVRFSRYGEVIDQDRVGTCVSPRLEELIESAQRRGLDRVTIHLEACRGRARVRITINEFGKESQVEQIGRCLSR